MSIPRAATERVLPTMNPDGSRRWLRPVLSPGRFWRARRVVAYGLMVVFFLIPYLRMNGKPLVLLDIPRREFTLLGYTFLPTDTLLFMLLFVSVAVTIFLLTALFGRIWCGWGCPQTVYLEFLFRPLERLIEGRPGGGPALQRVGAARRALKYAVYLLLALFLAHTFLAYFVGIDRLVQWVRLSPLEHPTAFLTMALTTGAIFFDFTWFREQTCLVACPYGRLQSVLLDRKSLIVAYQPLRGEPRSRGRERTGTSGDCIDCGACVRTCPTGIDIRDGLQMECIHCTQCMDACDEIMDRIEKPRGLIKYSNRCEVEGRPARLLRPRVLIYPAALLVVVSLLGYSLATKQDTDVTLLRGIGAPYSFDAEGQVVNTIRIKLTNRAETERRYRIELLDGDGLRVLVPENPLPVAAGAIRTEGVFVMAPPTAFDDGRRAIRFRISDGDRFTASFEYLLVGPREGEHR